MPHSFDHWADTDDALDTALMWGAHHGLPILAMTDRQILAGFLATPDAADAYDRYCDDLIADHADRQQEERRDR
jgi:hypothetical protein